MLKLEAAHKAETIKRKTEEVQKLREKQKQDGNNLRRGRIFPVASSSNELMTKSDFSSTPIQSYTPMRSKKLSLHNSTTVVYSPIRAKRQWNTMEKMVTLFLVSK